MMVQVCGRHPGKLDGGVGSWLLPGPAMAAGSIWEVNQYKEDVSLSFK